jgi:polyisoprenoid-binding protein YceI
MANSALNKLKSRAKSKTLVGKQKNLDVNKNGKLDKEDFKILRGEKMATGGEVKVFETKCQIERIM